MEPVRSAFLPDPSLDHDEMEALQREIAAAAVFEDDAPTLANACQGTSTADDAPIVAGVDQAFHDGAAVSAIVCTRGGAVVDRADAVRPTEIPYIPGLLAFREGGPIIAAFDALETEPDVALFDGSGRIHYRQAGLATHVGVTLDLPTIGVAKRLLCGRPRDSLAENHPVGTRIAIEADEAVETASGTVIGYAVQTRQFDHPDRHVNPVYVSPGHRVSAASAADVVEDCCAGYKLPEPIRLADRYADDLTADLG